MLDPVDLDVIGALEGSDKSSSVQSSWEYLRQYEVLFGEFRTDPINVMEVGLAQGASLKVWKWFFSKATIVGIDIVPRCAAYAEDRVVVEIGSQVDRKFLKGVCERHPPTIFIDDGSHLAEHNIVTFETVFPNLLPGGLYVVEDLAFHFGPKAVNWQTKDVRDSPGYFLDLARHCVSMGRAGGEIATPAKLAATVESVTFIGSAAVIRKARAARSAKRGIKTADTYMASRALSGAAQVRLAAWILRHQGSPDRAEQALDAAAAAGGAGTASLLLRGRLLRSRNRLDEAIAILTEAVDQDQVEPPMLRNLARELAACGSPDQAIRAAEKALASDPDNLQSRTTLAAIRKARPETPVE